MCVGALVFGFVYGRYGPVAMYLSSSCLAAVCFLSYTTLYLLVPALHEPQPKPALESESNANANANGNAADITAAAGAASGAAGEPDSDALNINLNHVSHSLASASGKSGSGERDGDEVAEEDEASAEQVLVLVPHSETAQSIASVDSEAPLLHSSPSRQREPERKRPLAGIPEHSVPARSPRLPHAARPNSEHSAQQASLRERMANARSRFFLS